MQAARTYPLRLRSARRFALYLTRHRINPHASRMCMVYVSYLGSFVILRTWAGSSIGRSEDNLGQPRAQGTWQTLGLVVTLR